MGQFFSYIVGVLVAGLLVFGLYLALQMGSPAEARQVNADLAAEKTLKELDFMLRKGTRAEKVAAITAVGQGDDQIEQRVFLIARTTANPDRTINSICRLSIEWLGDRVKPTVRKLLGDENPDVVRSACGVIRSMGKGSSDFNDDIAKLLTDGDHNDRHAALYALQDMEEEAIMPLLDNVIKELDSPNFNTQCIACFVLKRIGPKAKPATARLIQLVEEGIPSSRSRAAETLAVIGPVEGHDVVGLIASQLDQFANTEKLRGLEAIGVLGPVAKPHLDRIEHLMETPKLNCQPQAALAYYRVSGDANRSLAKLKDLLRTRGTRMASIECVGGMGDAASSLVPDLMEYLVDEDLAIAETAVLAIKQIGPGAEEALPRLKKMLTHGDYLIEVAAQEAIDAITAGADK